MDTEFFVFLILRLLELWGLGDGPACPCLKTAQSLLTAKSWEATYLHEWSNYEYIDQEKLLE